MWAAEPENASLDGRPPFMTVRRVSHEMPTRELKERLALLARVLPVHRSCPLSLLSYKRRCMGMGRGLQRRTTGELSRIGCLRGTAAGLLRRHTSGEACRLEARSASPNLGAWEYRDHVRYSRRR
jgi:hypothetical protein